MQRVPRHWLSWGRTVIQPYGQALKSVKFALPRINNWPCPPGVADWVPVGISSICSKIALTLTSAVGHFADMARYGDEGCFQSRSGHGALEFREAVNCWSEHEPPGGARPRRGFSLGMASAIIGNLVRPLRSTRRLRPRGRHAMSTIAIAILVLLAWPVTADLFNGDLGTGPAGRLGLVLAGPCLAAALWCLWWSRLAPLMWFAAPDAK